MSNHTKLPSQDLNMRVFTGTPPYDIQSKNDAETMSFFHYHTCYELDYIEAGSRNYYIEDKLFTAYAGNFVLIKPYKYHRAEGNRSSRIIIMLSIEFMLKSFTPTAVRDFLNCFCQPIICPTKSVLLQCLSILEQLKKCNSDTHSALYLATLLLELSRCPIIDTQGTTTPVSHITDYINNNFGQITNIEQIAAHFYISKYHLCHIFKKYMDITIIDYLNNTKIRNACHYLESTDKDLLEISELCGFNSSAYFCNIFKKITTLSPSKYRKLYKKSADNYFD